MKFLKYLVFFAAILPAGMLASCDQSPGDVLDFFVEPVVKMKFINQDSLNAIAEAQKLIEWNRNANTQAISSAQDDKEIIADLLEAVQTLQINNNQALLNLEELKQKSIDSLKQNLDEYNNLPDPGDSIRRLRRQSELLLDYDQYLLGKVKERRSKLTAPESQDPLVLQSVVAIINQDLIQTYDRELDLLTRDSNILAQTTRTIESGRLRLDSILGIGGEKTLVFRDSLNNDSLQVFNFPLNMEEDNSTFVVYIQQEADTITLTYNRNLEETNDFALIRAFDVEVQDHTFQEIEVDCRTNDCQSNETTITAYF